MDILRLGANFGSANAYFLSATLQIYSDGECYYINSCPFQRSAI